MVDGIDLTALVERILTRGPNRTESDLQADIQTLLVHGGLELADAQVRLESPSGDGTRRRIDVEVGRTVIEVKKDLTKQSIVSEAMAQLAGYLRLRTATVGDRFVGILTDGVQWRLVTLVGEEPIEVSRLELGERDPDVGERLVTWLEAVLATAHTIAPSPASITERLGSDSPGFALDVADITAMYEVVASHPDVKLKRALWAKLLTTALGTAFKDETRLFIEHTYLVLIAEVIAHAVVGFDISSGQLTPATLVSGAAFAESEITGVVEQDFFDWIITAPGGGKFVERLARRLSRFDWSHPQHDVLKVLYESVINAESRHSLGEYYTPDWLADRVVREAIPDPLTCRALDPACGSGTFVFHAVRNYIAAAEEAGRDSADAVLAVTSHVSGMDVHPVAVTLARVTYLLALGTRRLSDPNRGPIAIPVYLGDSLQWDHEVGTLNAGELVVPTGEGSALFSRELRFPERVTANAAVFDRLVNRLTELATTRTPGSAVPNLATAFAQYAVHPDDQAELRETFTTMCQLNDEGRNHIWGYYVRNLARPLWLARPENHVDVLIGNPPWLSYRFMPTTMRTRFADAAKARGMWAGSKVATNQDLSAYFAARTIELYLKPGGRFAYVMPFAVLSRLAYAGFRTGAFVPPSTETSRASMFSSSPAVTFAPAWDFHRITPNIFPVPPAVVFGEYTPGRAGPLGAEVLAWSGHLPAITMDWDTAKGFLQVAPGKVQLFDEGADVSPYRDRFRQGATLVPRVLLMVTDAAGSSPLGAGAGRMRVASARSNLEKAPWKGLPTITGTVESEFVRPVLMGASIGPYRLLTSERAVLPVKDGNILASTGDPAPIDHYPSVAAWWRNAARLWLDFRSPASKITLDEQIDWQGKLRGQHPAAPFRVVYAGSGTLLSATVVTNERAIVEHGAYWANCSSLDEARYLTGIINSAVLLARVIGLQSRGRADRRHFDLLVFSVPFPLFDQVDVMHAELVRAVADAERVVAGVDLAPARTFTVARRLIRTALDGAGVTVRIENAVEAVLEGVGA